MKNRDFQGIQKYKLIMPCFFILNIFLVIFGPSYCPHFTHMLYFVWTFLVAVKTVHMGLISFYCLSQNKRIIHRFKNQLNLKITQGQPEIFHVIIIPNYNETIETLRQTLTTLAKHTRAPETYLIYLAIQKKEINSQEKARNLITEFRQKFKNIDFTVHQLLLHEYASKAANVNYCARQLERKFQDLNISIENCYLTIIDADAEVLELYFVQMEDHIKANWEKRFTFVYGPYNIFTKNHLNVPALTRVYDHMISSLQTSNIVNLTGFGFSISNYSVSYNLAKKIDFWDTNEQSITEDLHFMQKACWKTEGEMTTVPIFVPVNLENIQTGQGYWADLKAKFLQTERHFRCCNQFAYAMRMFFNEKLTWGTFKMMFTIFDTLALQAFYPIVMFGLVYHKSLLTPAQMALLPVSYETIDFISFLSLLGIVSFMFNYEILTRRSNEKLFGNKNREWYKSLELIYLFPAAQLFILFPANLCAIFGSLQSNRGWFMARNTNNKSVKV